MSRLHRFTTHVLAVFAAFAVSSGFAAFARAQEPYVIDTPATTGDQLFFVYDATENRVPFLVVSNLAPSALVVEAAWYDQDLSDLLATQVETLAPGGNRIFDPSQVQGVQGNAGLMVVTPVADANDPTPIVPPARQGDAGGPLFGGFTLADLTTRSGFGQNPLGRLAVTADGRRAAEGSIVDGTIVRYQAISPTMLTIPFYFAPGSDGLSDRVILGEFQDSYTPGGFRIFSGGAAMGPTVIDAGGTVVYEAQAFEDFLQFEGLHFGTVESLAGRELTTSGKILLTTGADPRSPIINVFGLMSQSLGTFSVGQRMPGQMFQRLTEPQAADYPQTTAGPQNVAGEGANATIGRVNPIAGLPDPSGESFDQQVGQTITGTELAWLDEVRVRVRRFGDPSSGEPIVLEIRPVGADQAPEGDDRELLGAVRVLPSDLEGLSDGGPPVWASFDTRGLGILLDQGGRLAFTLKTADTTGYLILVAGESSAAYGGGDGYLRNRASGEPWNAGGRDLAFQTRVRALQ